MWMYSNVLSWVRSLAYRHTALSSLSSPHAVLRLWPGLNIQSLLNFTQILHVHCWAVAKSYFTVLRYSSTAKLERLDFTQSHAWSCWETQCMLIWWSSDMWRNKTFLEREEMIYTSYIQITDSSWMLDKVAFEEPWSKHLLHATYNALMRNIFTVIF